MLNHTGNAYNASNLITSVCRRASDWANGACHWHRFWRYARSTVATVYAKVVKTLHFLIVFLQWSLSCCLKNNSLQYSSTLTWNGPTSCVTVSFAY